MVGLCVAACVGISLQMHLLVLLQTRRRLQVLASPPPGAALHPMPFPSTLPTPQTFFSFHKLTTEALHFIVSGLAIMHHSSKSLSTTFSN